MKTLVVRFRWIPELAPGPTSRFLDWTDYNQVISDIDDGKLTIKTLDEGSKGMEYRLIERTIMDRIIEL